MKFPVSIFVALLGFSVAAPAFAWCRTTTCNQLPPPASCGNIDPSQCTTNGMPIAWPSTCVSTSVSAHGSAKRNISPAQLREIVQRAFRNWTAADCGGGTHPNFVVDFFPDVNCTDVTGDAGYKSTGPNTNVWVFDDDAWPYGASGEHAYAITTTQFNPETAVIFDSDVELNSNVEGIGAAQITVGDTDVGIDLASIVQHESGHFLGLSHSELPTATMYAYMDPATVSKRTLTQDDIDAICNTYPPGKLDPNCDPEPRHGFSTECTFEGKGCCAIAPGRASRTHRGLEGVLLGTLVALAIVRRRRQTLAVFWGVMTARKRARVPGERRHCASSLRMGTQRRTKCDNLCPSCNRVAHLPLECFVTASPTVPRCSPFLSSRG